MWWLLTRPALLLAGYLAIPLIGYAPPDVVTVQRVSANDLTNLPARWDALFYLQIAERGYSWNGSNVVGQTVAFFPGFPLAMRVAARASGLPTLWAGTLVSLGAFLFALVYLYRLASDLLDSQTAWGAVALLATYPAAVFFGAAYTESLFLLACLGAFYHFRRREFTASSAWALIAGLTRVQGFLLCAPLAWMAWRDRKTQTGSMPRAASLFAVVAPVLGLALFSAYLYRLTGRPLVWLENQAGWGQPYYDQLLHGALPVPADTPGPIPLTDALLYVENRLAVVFVVALVPLAVRWLGLEYALFMLVCIGPPMVGHPFTSLMRFTSVVFPAFIVLARALGNPRRVHVVAAIFFAAQVVAAATFFTWRHFL